MKQARISTLLAAMCLAVAPAAFAAGNTNGSQPSAQGSQPMQSQSQNGTASAQSSEQVREAQQQLSQRGHDPGPADGIAGERTRAAVKDFQQAQGLPATGQLDRQTMAALDSNAPGSSSPGAAPRSPSTAPGSPSTTPGSTPGSPSSSSAPGASGTPSNSTPTPGGAPRPSEPGTTGSGAGATK